MRVVRGLPPVLKRVRWYKLAADQGHVNARETLNTAYRIDGGFFRSLGSALGWQASVNK
jgi:TPR repeat protein